MLKPADRASILESINQEGFNYAFIDYSDFPDIKDRQFHQLREAYVKAEKALAKYVGYVE